MYLNIIAALAAIVVGSLVLWFLSAKNKSGPLLGKPIPGPNPHPIFGHAPLIKNGIAPWLETVHKEFPGIASIKAGPYRICSVADPDLVEQVLKNYKLFTNSEFFRETWGLLFPQSVITLEGEEWKKVRKLVQDGVQRQRLGKLIIEARDTTLKMMSKLREKGLNQPVDMQPLIMYCLFDAFGKFGFGVNFNTLDGENLDVLHKTTSLWSGIATWQKVPLKWYKFIPTPTNLAIYSNARWTRKFATDLIGKRRAALASVDDASESADNLLDALIKARDGESSTQLTEEEIVDNVVVLSFASFETTGGSLCFLIDLLATHQDIQEKVYKEICELADDYEHWDDAKRILTATESLPYLEMCIKESARLRPVAAGTPRTALQDCEVAGYHIHKDEVMLLNNIGMCKDPKIWNTTPEDILKFRPERWESISVSDVKHSYLPFGAGGRMCVGFRIANLEMKAIMTTLLRAFKIKPDTSRPPMEINKGEVTMKPLDGNWVVLEPRSV